MKKIFFVFFILFTSIVHSTNFEDALKAYNNNDLKTAYEGFYTLAEQGDLTAQYNIAHMYENGKWVEKDFKKAIFWYEKSAKKGYGRSQYYLGVMYDHGIVVEQDFKKAVFWYEKSAKQGGYISQFNLGLMYHQGNGVAKDLKKTIFWYEKSAKQGYVIAQYNLGVMYHEGIEINQDYKKAEFWYKKATKQNYVQAEKNINHLYSHVKFTKEQICISAISSIMGKNPSIVKISSINKDITYLYYIRKSDNTKWDFRCKVSNNVVTWSTATGTWRNGEYASVVTFTTNRNKINIYERHSDGSKTVKKYDYNQLIN